MVELKNMTAGYVRNKPVLIDISMDVAKGEVVAILGQNGSGKSTLGKSIFGMIPYVNGKITLNSVQINTMTPDKIYGLGCAFFMQGGVVFPHLTIKENLLFAGGKLKMELFQERLNGLAEHFAVLDIENHKFMGTQASYLSGGEKHMLALAMVLLSNPKFIILDEPSAGLSPASTEAMYEILRKVKEYDHLTIMLIEQNVDKAFKFADRCLVIDPQTKNLKEISSISDIENVYFG